MTTHYIDPVNGDDNTLDDTNPTTPRQNYTGNLYIDGDTYLQKRDTIADESVDVDRGTLIFGSYSESDGSDNPLLALPIITGLGGSGVLFTRSGTIRTDLSNLSLRPVGPLDDVLGYNTPGVLNVDGVEVIGDGTQNRMSIQGESGSTFKNMNVSGIEINTFLTPGDYLSDVNDITIDTCIIDGGSDAVVNKKAQTQPFSTRRWKVLNCTLTNQVENALDIHSGSDHKVSNNNISGAGQTSITIASSSGTDGDHADYVDVERNVVSEGGHAGLQIQDYCLNTTMFCNSVYNCGKAANANGLHVIGLGGTGARNARFNNNTIVAGPETVRAGVASNEDHTVSFTNNICVTKTGQLAMIFDAKVNLANWFLDTNMYNPNGAAALFDSGTGGAIYNTLAEWQAGESKDPNSLEGDPLFVDFAGGDYNLQQASPAVGTGVKWWGNGPRPESLSGEPLPDEGVDMGAYQSTWHPRHPLNLAGGGVDVAIDMDADGSPDTVLFGNPGDGNLAVTTDANSINIDIDGDGTADTVIPL